MIELDIAEAQTIGGRAEQQDATTIVPLRGRCDSALLVLADGLGGHANGAEAARLVVEIFRERAEGGAFDAPDDRRAALNETLHAVNGRIRAGSDPADGERSMGSTAIAAVVGEGRVRWISVGDSHLYIWRGDRIAKLNADHSLAGMMIRGGHAPDSSAVLRARSTLGSALTGRAIEEIDCPVDDLPLAIGDVVLLASDGLDTLSGAEIAQIVGETPARGARATADALIAAVCAQRLPRQDNATVVVARVRGSGAPADFDDELASVAAIPLRSGDAGRRRRWPLAVGLALLASVLASVIMTQMP